MKIPILSWSQSNPPPSCSKENLYACHICMGTQLERFCG